MPLKSDFTHLIFSPFVLQRLLLPLQGGTAGRDENRRGESRGGREEEAKALTAVEAQLIQPGGVDRKIFLEKMNIFFAFFYPCHLPLIFNS